MQLGDIVRDTENPKDDLVVILTPDEKITGWYTDKEQGITVAERNPEYSEDENAIVCCYVNDMDENFDDWRKHRNPKEYFDMVTGNGIRFYAYPETRLEKHGLTSHHESLTRYGKTVRRNYREGAFKQQTWKLENPVKVDHLNIEIVRANRSKVVLVGENGKKTMLKKSEIVAGN